AARTPEGPERSFAAAGGGHRPVPGPATPTGRATAATGRAVHLRQVRGRADQPVCPRRGAHGGRGARLALEPAFHLWRRRTGEDAPASSDRARNPPAAPGVG